MDNERLAERLSNGFVDKVEWSILMKFIDDLWRYDPLRLITRMKLMTSRFQLLHLIWSLSFWWGQKSRQISNNGFVLPMTPQLSNFSIQCQTKIFPLIGFCMLDQWTRCRRNPLNTSVIIVSQFSIEILVLTFNNNPQSRLSARWTTFDPKKTVFSSWRCKPVKRDIWTSRLSSRHEFFLRSRARTPDRL